MFQVFTEEDSEKRRLQQQVCAKNGLFQVSFKQSLLISEMLRTISYEFFQDDIPILAEKVRDMIIGMLTMNCSFTLFREIMMLLQRQRETLSSYQQHFLDMNKHFSNQNLQPITKSSIIFHDQEDQIFQKALKGETHKGESLEIIQLPLVSQIRLDFKEDNITEKTMQSDIFQSSATKSGQKSTFNKLTCFFNSASAVFSREDWKTERKNQNKSDESKELNSFKKKGESIIAKNNIETLMQQQFNLDLQKQEHQKKSQKKHAQVQRFRYNRLLKDTLMNGKLKLRKKK